MKTRGAGAGGATRAQRQRPRLRDVAARARVSTMTVVRVMSAPEKVADATRRRVETVIADTGYTPDLLARGLALNRSGVVAAIVPLLTNSLVAEVVQGRPSATADRAVGHQERAIEIGGDQSDSGGDRDERRSLRFHERHAVRSGSVPSTRCFPAG